jgi:hypothetical protein
MEGNMLYTFNRDKIYIKIERIKELTQNEIKNIGLEDRSLINKIIDLYNSKKQSNCFFYFGFSDNPILKVDDEGCYNIDIDNYLSLEPPEPSNIFKKFFKGIFNFFGRVGSEELHNKIKQIESNGSMHTHYNKT